jgi:hypothetical protein
MLAAPWSAHDISYGLFAAPRALEIRSPGLVWLIQSGQSKAKQTVNVRYWPLADMPSRCEMSAFGGAADMPIALQNVR